MPSNLKTSNISNNLFTVKGKAPYAAPLSSRSGGLAENESVNFTCKADLGKPPGSIGWWLYRRNKDTPQDLTNAAIETPDSEGDPGICDNIVISTLPFKLDKDDNHAVIRCTVNQELLSSPTGKPQDMPYKQTDMLRVFYEVRKPEITKKPNALVYDVDTQSLTIQCFTIGNPNPFTTNDERKGKVTWYYKRSSDSNDILASQVPNIKITRREVVLQKLSESQAGIYTCEVRNRFKGIDYVQRSEVLIKIVSTMDHVYVDAEDIRNKKHVTMDIH
ncbi:hypothetical protein FSP39_000698 [Pinctada imbricata]|uniref:Ig-like domain-containing protein n=1 Tax=Pinctada imbricata TaxID=66713 RepID=A0AA88YWE2_PINIB|nr:hypothetical protein FSP39_000698 [Pinctada imbricata]